MEPNSPPLLARIRKNWPLRKPYHTRRTHAKSRKGCEPCKSARLKCDEAKPSCHRCHLRQHKCCYAKQPAANRSPNSVSPKPCLQPFALSEAHNELWYHFTTYTWATLADSRVNCVIKQSLALAFYHEDLKHAILALAATHQRFLLTQSQPECLAEQHLSKAVALFRLQLQSPPESSTMDAVLLTSSLLSTQNFFLSRSQFSHSWAYDDGGGLRWLTLLSGWRALLLQHKSWLSASMWAKTLPQTPGSSRIKLESTPTLEHMMLSLIPEHWRTVFEINEDEDLSCKAYGRALYDLAILTAREDHARPLTQVMTFAYRLDSRMLMSLHDRDPAAICILAMWLGCLCRIDIWWLSRRARLECYAACEYLNRTASDPQKCILASTAEVCGYKFDTE